MQTYGIYCESDQDGTDIDDYSSVFSRHIRTQLNKDCIVTSRSLNTKICGTESSFAALIATLGQGANAFCNISNKFKSYESENPLACSNANLGARVVIKM